MEYDEYDEKLTSAQNQEFSCITILSSFVQNMLLKDVVLDVDVSQYLKENWPLGDDQLEKTHDYTVWFRRGKKCAEVSLRVFIHVS